MWEKKTSGKEVQGTYQSLPKSSQQIETEV